MHLPLSRGPLWLEELLWHRSNIHICRPKPHKRFYCVSSGLRSGKGSSGAYEEIGSGWVLVQPERRWGDRVAQCPHCSLKLYPKLSEQGKISESNQKPSGRKSSSLRYLPTSLSLPWTLSSLGQELCLSFCGCAMTSASPAGTQEIITNRSTES